MIFWDKLRTEMARYADGVHEPGAPARRVPEGLSKALAELYRSFDGLRLFTDSFVIVPVAELVRDGKWLRIGEALGEPLWMDAGGRVYQGDDERILVGSDLARFLDAVMAREKLVVDREGEYKDVFVDEGELSVEVRRKRARAGLKADPGVAAFRLELAELAFEEGREDEAEAELEEAVDADPDAAAAWQLLGSLHRRAQRLREAAEAFAHAARAGVGGEVRAERFAEAARAAHSAGDEAARAAHAQGSIGADANAPARWREEAARRLEEGDSDGALRLGELAESVSPGSADELMKRARLKSKLKVF